MIDRFLANATPSAHTFVRKGWARPLWQQIRRGRGNVHEQDNNGNTLLNWAAYHGNEHCVRALLAQGADVNAANKSGWTPLHDAAAQGNESCVRVLLAQGADVYAKNWQRNTPLDWAIYNNHRAVCELFRAAITR